MADKVYFNWKGPQGRETVDELDYSETDSSGEKRFKSRKEFCAERNRMVSEYHLCGMAVYTSSRACANWK